MPGFELHVTPGRRSRNGARKRADAGWLCRRRPALAESDPSGNGPPLFWEGFDRIGDRNDPARQIWLTTFVAEGDGPPLAIPPVRIGDVARELRDALVAIEAVARADPWKKSFAEVFADARAVLDGAAPTDLGLGLDFVDYTALEADARKLLAASAAAWVFGGMGSWNDGTPDPPLAERYEATSDALFSALKWAVLAVANASLPALAR